MPGQQAARIVEPPRDLVDFHLRWPVFRPRMLSLLDSPEVNAEQVETLQWLIALSDRVGEADIA